VTLNHAAFADTVPSMRSVNKRLRAAFIALITLSATLPALSPATALSTGVRWVEASTWQYLQAGEFGGTPTTVLPPVFVTDGALSRFEIRYSSNFPEQAKAAFNAATAILGRHFVSSVPVVVEANWVRLSSGVLGGARPTRFYANFAGAPARDLWYTGALANSMAGADLDSTSSDIKANFSSAVPWSYDTNGVSYRGYFDMVTVVLHELVHGLGFLSNTAMSSTGLGTINQPTPFDAYARTPQEDRLVDLTSGSTELTTALTNPLQWVGPQAIAANGQVRPVMYSPSTYENGSSTSHLDERTYPNGSVNSLMTPELDPAEVIHQVGPITLAIFNDMRVAPPLPPVTTLPSQPRDVKAVVDENGAIISFNPPSDIRRTQVINYTVTTQPGGMTVTAPSSPVNIRGLQEGSTYLFTVIANNELGAGPAALTNAVTIPRPWNAQSVDTKADGASVAQAVWRGNTVIAYTDSRSGDLFISRWTGKSWQKTAVDGFSLGSGRTTNDLSGKISLCVSGSSNQILHVFYPDRIQQDLRHAWFDGKRWRYEVVDGDAATGQAIEATLRVRTNSDVSVSNACASTPDGLQVIYRDETLGILLGAVKSTRGWRYELIDGDRDRDGRTTGDVGFRIDAVTIGRTVHIIYDSVRFVDAQRQPTEGDVRYAFRNSARANSWTYRTLEAGGAGFPVAGYDVALGTNGKRLFAAWLAATPGLSETPVVNTLKWSEISGGSPRLVRQSTSPLLGAPSGPLAIDGRSLAFGCGGRVCQNNLTGSGGALISGKRVGVLSTVTWVSPIAAGKRSTRGLLVGLDGSLRLLRP
jgi:hypothetical protein